MWLLCLASVLLAVTAPSTGQAGQLYASAPQNRGQYYRGLSGSYNYGYNTGDGVAKVEVKRPDGSVVGSYRYFDPNGKQIVRSYIADSNGFRILGNDLPINPETPAAAVLGAPALTGSVEGAAPEVVDAAQHHTKPQTTVDINRITSSVQARTAETAEEETGSSNNYYYFPYLYNYDFPAGFAYPTLLAAPQPEPTIVGHSQRQETNENSLTLGSAQQYSADPPVSVVSRKLRPLVVRPPFTVGRA